MKTWKRREKMTPTGETIEEYRDRYVKARLLENMLLGIHPEVIREERARLDVEFAFDEDEYYMFLIGIGRSADSRYLKDNDRILLTRNPVLAERTKRFMEESGWKRESAAVNPEKISCFFVSRGQDGNALSIDALCQGIMRIYQESYDMYIPKDGMSHRAFVVVSEKLHGMEQVHPTFEALMKWHSLSFFFMDNVVADREWLRKRYCPTDGQELIFELRELWKELYHRQDEPKRPLSKEIDRLIQGKLKNSFSLSLAERFLLTFCQEYDEWQQSFCPEHPVSLNLSLKDFATVEEMAHRLSQLWNSCEEQSLTQRPASLVTYRALRYLQKNYAAPSVLEDTAQRLHVTSRYLRRVFREDMGVSPYEYVTNIRLEAAKRLLQDGCLIQDAARQVGFESAGYFSRYFGKHMGQTPREWQKRLECGQSDKR